MFTLYVSFLSNLHNYRKAENCHFSAKQHILQKILN